MDVLGALLHAEVSIAASGPNPADLSWARYESLDLWPTWSPQLQRAECDVRTLAVGASGRVVGPLGVSAEFDILDVDPAARRWNWRVHRGPLTVELDHGVDPEGEGSRTWLRLRGPLPVITAYAPVAWIALHRLVTT